MTRTRAAASLVLAAVLSAACSERTPTGPLPSAAAGSAAPTDARPAADNARSATRAIGPRTVGPGAPVVRWGGIGMNLTVGAAGAFVDFDCAHGTIDQPFVLDASGRFDLAGTFVQESPGPVRDGVVAPAFPARYSGSTDGQTMTLTVTVNGDARAHGPFLLTSGTPGRVFKCL